MFAWWGQFVYRFRWPVLGVSAILLTASIIALLNGGTLKNSGGSNTESGRAVALIQNQLPQNGAGLGEAPKQRQRADFAFQRREARYDGSGRDLDRQPTLRDGERCPHALGRWQRVPPRHRGAAQGRFQLLGRFGAICHAQRCGAA